MLWFGRVPKLRRALNDSRGRARPQPNYFRAETHEDPAWLAGTFFLAAARQQAQDRTDRPHAMWAAPARGGRFLQASSGWEYDGAGPRDPRAARRCGRLQVGTFMLLGRCEFLFFFLAAGVTVRYAFAGVATVVAARRVKG